MRITALELENIGVFEQLHLEFSEKMQPDKAEIHIFTGENGTGKSTLLYALATIVGADFTQLTSRCDVEKENLITVSYKHQDFAHSTNKNISKQSSDISNPLMGGYGSYLYNLSIDKLPKRKFDFVFFAYSGNRYMQKYDIKTIEETYNNPLYNSLDFHNSIDNKALIQWLANTITNEAIEKGQGNFEQAAKYRKILTMIEQILSEIIGKEIKISLATKPYRIIVKIDEKNCGIDSLPDGIKSILSWVADLLMKLDNLAWENDTPLLERNFILFLDEIEVHLHPAWQRKVLPVVQKLFPNAQIFISTHSPFVVGSVDGAYIYKFGLDEQGNSHLLQPPSISDTSQSYALILEEIFGIDETFGDNVEKDLDEFYEIRDELLANKKDRESQFINLTNKLLHKSLETRTIVGSEIRQLNRKLGTSYAV